MNTRAFSMVLIVVVLAGGALMVASCSSAGSNSQADSGADADSDTDGDADGDADSDADGDTDADTDTDTDGDTDGGCEKAGDMTFCTTDNECSGESQASTCASLFEDVLEAMSETEILCNYCYPACDSSNPCADTSQICVTPNDATTEGNCLNGGYWEHNWQGKFVPNGIDPNLYITFQDSTFQAGSLDITFTMSVVAEVDDPTAGHLMVIAYFNSPNPTQYVLNVNVPYDDFVAGKTIQFADCVAAGKPCNASIVEVLIQGTTVTDVFVRAISLVDQIGTHENWVKIDTANLVQGETSTGSAKIFLAEYTVKIPNE